MSQKRIYVAYTGGTIGMQQSSHGFIPVPGFLTKTVQSMPEFYRAEMPAFSIHEYPELIDSSDMTPVHWLQIARDIQANYQHYDGFNAFASPNFPPLLEAGIQIRLKAGALGETARVGSQLNVAHVVPQPISVVTLYPGISADVISNMAKAPVKALIIKSYGIGNAPQQPALLAALAAATENGVIIVNCTQCFSGRVNMDGYATGKALKVCGVISGYDMTLEATLTKLHYLLSRPLSGETVRQKMQQDLRGELSH